MDRRGKTLATPLAILIVFFIAILPNPRVEARGGRIVGRIGGAVRAACMRDAMVYAGVGARLVVLDASNPAAPVVRGATRPFPYDVEDVVVEGTMVYVAAGGAGLRVVDVSDPGNPFETGAWDSPGYGEGVAKTGSVALLADGPYGLRVVDVSDPARPVETGHACPMNHVLDVAVWENHAWLAAAGAGLLVVDVSDPANPVHTASFDTPGFAYGVSVGDGVARVADAWEGVRLVDASDPSTPVSIGACDTPGWALDAVAAGSRIYVADGANGMRVLDASDPSAIHELGTLDISGLGRRIAAGDGLALLVDPLGGLRLIDVTDPAGPAEAGAYRSLTDARRIALSGSRAYVAAGSSLEMRIVDVSDPARPREVGVYDANGGHVEDVAVRENRAYVAAYGGAWEEALGGFCALHVLDVSDPAHPKRIGGVSTEGAHRQLALVGDLVYVADEWGVRAISAADPENPVEVGFLRTYYETRETVGITVSDGLAYLAASMGGVVIVDISDPTDMKLVGACDVRDFVFEAAVVGDTAYASAADGVYVLDVSDPSAPSMVNRVDTSGLGYGVTVDGEVAYVSDGGGGIQVLDLSNPSSPTLTETLDTHGIAYDAVLHGNHVYIADGPGGLVIIEKSGAALVQKELDPGALAHAGQVVEGEKKVWERIDSRPVFTNRSLPMSREATRKTRDEKKIFGIHSPPNPTSPRQVFPPNEKASRKNLDLVVNSAADDGPGSLRERLASAGEGDVITFDPGVFPPSVPVSIYITDQLPPVTAGGVAIDASEAGVIIDGSGASPGVDGFLVESSGNTIKGFEICDFPGHGVRISGNRNIVGGDRSEGGGSTGEGNVISGCGGVGLLIYGSENRVRGNFIGVDASGSAAHGNGIGGVQLEGAGNIVGGDVDGEKNVISGNSGAGVQIQGVGAENNIILGNYIGMDVTGAAALGNDVGVRLAYGASRNRVGGAAPGARNIISGNRESGIMLIQEDVEENAITGNFIGVDVSGVRASGNGREGVLITEGSCSNTLGGCNPGEGNVISGNENVGVLIGGAKPTLHNTVVGNFIGVDATGGTPIGNALGGVIINTYGFNRIGGVKSGERNVISGNKGPGVAMGGCVIFDNLVLGNYIGPDASGARAVGNDEGVAISEGMRRNFVGGATEGERNIISGNGAGVVIRQAGVQYNWIMGNYIGASADGMEALGNDVGVLLEDHAARNLVQENLISGNREAGVSIRTNAGFNQLRANRIGPSANGASGFPPGDVGVRVEAPQNIVGGPYAGDGNIIAFNSGDGVLISNYDGNLIQGNIIESNGGVGVDSSGASCVTGNKITGNRSCGVRASILEEFSGNDVHGNTMYEFRYDGSAPQAAENNYWGSTDLSAIDARIHDDENDPGVGRVDYEPFASAPFFSAPSAPTLTMEVSGVSVTISWTSAPDAVGYIFLYAPYPTPGYIGDIDVGDLTGPFTLELPSGAAFYMAVLAYNRFGAGDLSNIEYVVLPGP